jgi:hypothetical protein
MISIIEALAAFNKIRDELMCPVDESMVFAKLTDDDEIRVYCVTCSWAQTLGENAKSNILAQAALTSD